MALIRVLCSASQFACFQIDSRPNPKIPRNLKRPLVCLAVQVAQSAGHQRS